MLKCLGDRCVYGPPQFVRGNFNYADFIVEPNATSILFWTSLTPFTSRASRSASFLTVSITT